MLKKIIEEIAQETGIAEAKLAAVWNNAIHKAEINRVKNRDDYAMSALEYIRKTKGLDESQRYIDDNGSLIAPNSIITGSDVANYLGAEIPGAEALGLDLNKIYSVYRPISQIKDNDFNGKYLLDKHVADLDSSTMEKHRNRIIGTVYDCEIVGDQLKGTVSLTHIDAIDDLDNGKKYLSAGYWYDPVLEAGQFNGNPYDIRMENIRANHVALVDNPRYKKAVVGDEDKNNLNKIGAKTMKLKLKDKFPALFGMFNKKLGLDEDLSEQALTGMDEKMSEEELKKAEDEAAESEKKAADEAAEKEKLESEKKATDDELAKLKEEKSDKGMDSAAVTKLVASEVSKALDSYTKSLNQNTKAMDAALVTYAQAFGSVNRQAFDSADEVYESILTSSGAQFDKDASADYKRGLAEALTQQRTPRTSTNLTLDDNSLSGVSSELQKLLKGN